MLPGSAYYYSDPTVPLLSSDLTKCCKAAINDCRRFRCHYGTIQTCPGLLPVSPEPGVPLCHGNARLLSSIGDIMAQDRGCGSSGTLGRAAGQAEGTHRMQHEWGPKIMHRTWAQCPEATREPACGPQPPWLSS